MTDREMDNLSYDIKRLENQKNAFYFNSIAEELKTTGLVLICKTLFAILKEVKK